MANCSICGGMIREGQEGFYYDDYRAEHRRASDCIVEFKQRLAAAEARNAEASKALVLAWGGVCPLDWECDCTNWQMMAEQIRSRGDELQARLAAAEAAARWCERRLDNIDDIGEALERWPWLADEVKEVSE